MNFKELFRNSHLGLMKVLKRTIHIPVAGVIVENEGKFLLVEEGSDIIPKIYGKWNFPIGIMKNGENPYRRALRSGRKETGLFLKINSEVGPSRKKNSYCVKIGKINMEVHLFWASIIRGVLEVPSDLLGVQFFSLEEIEKLKEEGKLVNHYILSAIADYQKLISRRRGNNQGGD